MLLPEESLLEVWRAFAAPEPSPGSRQACNCTSPNCAAANVYNNQPARLSSESIRSKSVATDPLSAVCASYDRPSEPIGYVLPFHLVVTRTGDMTSLRDALQAGRKPAERLSRYAAATSVPFHASSSNHGLRPAPSTRSNPPAGQGAASAASPRSGAGQTRRGSLDSSLQAHISPVEDCSPSLSRPRSILRIDSRRNSLPDQHDLLRLQCGNDGWRSASMGASSGQRKAVRWMEGRSISEVGIFNALHPVAGSVHAATDVKGMARSGGGRACVDDSMLHSADSVHQQLMRQHAFAIGSPDALKVTGGAVHAVDAIAAQHLKQVWETSDAAIDPTARSLHAVKEFYEHATALYDHHQPLAFEQHVSVPTTRPCGDIESGKVGFRVPHAGFE